ncbi:hypothetical protein ABIA39_008211 [Nocardia sp. GAS34]|uniref:hypothetical protein n=1 Tax=unclassified Nocardia TaxID=2637762 RepID=UPI003D222CA0
MARWTALFPLVDETAAVHSLSVAKHEIVPRLRTHTPGSASGSQKWTGGDTGAARRADSTNALSFGNAITRNGRGARSLFASGLSCADADATSDVQDLRVVGEQESSHGSHRVNRQPDLEQGAVPWVIRAGRPESHLK